MIVILVNNFGQVIFELKDYEVVVMYYWKSLELNCKQGFLVQLVVFYINLFYVFMFNKQYDQVKLLVDFGVFFVKGIQMYDFFGQLYYVEGLIVVFINWIGDVKKYIDFIE